MDSQSARYAPMNHSHILGFPNRMPYIDWQTYLSKFKDEERDDVDLHLIKFHMHSRKLKVKWHEYCLMNIFMATLEGKARSWYENFPHASLYSLKYFHTILYENDRESYPSLLLVENCCEHFDSFIQNLENMHGDEEFMDEEIQEALYENPSQNQEETVEDNCHHTHENFSRL